MKSCWSIPGCRAKAEPWKRKQATLFLGPDNEVQRVLATGNVNAESAGEDADPMRARADEAEVLLTGKQNLLHSATLTGNVHVERIGAQPMQGDAGRAILDFLGQNQLQKVHAMDGVHLAQHGASTGAPPTGSSASSAPTSSGNSSATSPRPRISTLPLRWSISLWLKVSAWTMPKLPGRRRSQSPRRRTRVRQPRNFAQASTQRTVITAGRFDAKFAATPDGSSRLSSIHGAPDAKIVNLAPGLPARVSTSQTLDATFFPQGGIESIIQQGSVAYDDGQAPSKRTQAWADKALYTPADRILVLTGSPRVSEGSHAHNRSDNPHQSRHR